MRIRRDVEMPLNEDEKEFLKTLFEDHLYDLEDQFIDGKVMFEEAVKDVLRILSICQKLYIEIPEKIVEVIETIIKGKK